MTNILARLQNGLVVSCQPVPDGPMDRPEIVAALAAAAIAGGAAGIRIEGLANLRAARAITDAPIIGLVKRDLSDTPVRITPFTKDIRDLAEAGANIIAIDATDRVRPETVADLVAEIHAAGLIGMADCATEADANRARRLGVAIIGTTLSGYTDATRRNDDAPDLDLVRRFCRLGGFVMAEGRYHTPASVAAAIAAGADCVTVGTALTRLEVMTTTFRDAIAHAKRQDIPVYPDQLSGVAIDLGGTKIAAARITAGRIVAQETTETAPHAPADAQVATIARLAKLVGHKPGAPLGVAVAGRIDDAGLWHAVNTGTLSAISAVPLARMIAAALGPAVCVNDAAAAALAEARMGAGQGLQNFAFLTVSTGVGAGLVLGDHLVRSRSGLAGHVGFSTVSRADTLCDSGRSGTVESVAGGRAMAAAALATGRNLDARAICQAACAGDEWAEAIIERSARAVATAIADLNATFGLDGVAIGGSIGLSVGYIDRVRRALEQEPLLFRVPVTQAALGTAAPLFGALLHCQDQAPS
jgi:putative N-acetylmannosamine-6-phosphate epimerase/predicted NBD/HSP70 family sugar kinase